MYREKCSQFPFFLFHKSEPYNSSAHTPNGKKSEKKDRICWRTASVSFLWACGTVVRRDVNFFVVMVAVFFKVYHSVFVKYDNKEWVFKTVWCSTVLRNQRCAKKTKRPHNNGRWMCPSLTLFQAWSWNDKFAQWRFEHFQKEADQKRLPWQKTVQFSLL